MKLHEKYLKSRVKVDEASKKEEYDKVVKVIRSTKTIDQLRMAEKMAAAFIKKNKEYSDMGGVSKKGDTLLDILKDQEKRIMHMKNVKKESKDLGPKYKCDRCGWVYDPEKEGKSFADQPSSYKCPECGAPKSEFSKM